MLQYLTIGKIVNTHGLRGEVKVLSLTDDPSRYDELDWVYIDKGAGLETYSIEGVKYFKNFVIIKFKEIQNINEAERLKGYELKVDREHAIKLPEDQFFICDLIGCEVYEEDGNRLGVLKDVIQTGSNDVYVVRNGKNEVLIPALKSVVTEVNIEQRNIKVVLPEGLIDDEV